MRVLLDTNVLVSAFATRGICADVLRVVLAEHTFVTAEVVLTELVRVLGKRMGLPPVASAIASRADVLVTGDRDLLDIAPAAPIRLVDPRGFWNLVRNDQ